jgi:hypothetical protein
MELERAKRLRKEFSLSEAESFYPGNTTLSKNNTGFSLDSLFF